MNKKRTSTVDQFMKSLSPAERKAMENDYQELLLSELILAVMEQDNLSVRRLAQLAGVSPTIVQAMRTGAKKDFSMQSFFKVLKGMGCKSFMIELNGQYIPLHIPVQKK
jgi:hypothetical protein